MLISIQSPAMYLAVTGLSRSKGTTVERLGCVDECSLGCNVLQGTTVKVMSYYYSLTISKNLDANIMLRCIFLFPQSIKRDWTFWKSCILGISMFGWKEVGRLIFRRIFERKRRIESEEGLGWFSGWGSIWLLKQRTTVTSKKLGR